MSAAFDLQSREFYQDPYPTYRRILAEAPVHWNESVGGWFVARHADVAPALRDPRLSADRFAPVMKSLPPEMLAKLAPIAQVTSRWTVIMDPPEHTRLRSLTSKGFAPRVIEALRPRIEALAGELLDAALAKPTFDVVADFAFPLPSAVILELLGGSPADRAQFGAWVDPIMRFFAAGRFDDALIAETTASLENMGAYVQAIVDERRRAPREDLVSHLLAVRDEGRALSDAEIVAESILLLVAGNDTTKNAISSGALTLIEHPEVRARIAAEPGLLRRAVEEILRYESPFQRIGRMAAEDVTLGGVSIPKGALIWLGLGPANRDPAVFPDPDSFKLDRGDDRHVAFGLGPHYCEGASLARLEIEVALGALLRRAPALRLAVSRAELRWMNQINTRELLALPVGHG